MDEGDRRARYDKQTEELYASIGRFAVKFEHVCEAMAEAILFVLQGNGLRSQPLGQALLAGLTAEPLQKIFGAVMAQVCPEEADRRILAGFLKGVRALTEHRNNVIHRTWFVGWASETGTDFSKVTGLKIVNTKLGPEHRILNYTCADFDELSRQADELTSLIREAGVLVGMEEALGRTLSSRYMLDADGTVRRLP